MSEISISVKVSTQELRAAADNVQNNVSTMQRSFDEMNTIVKNTVSYWEGEGGDYFRTNYDSYKDDVLQVLNRLKEQITDLRQMAGIYEETEKAAASVGSGLPDDAIF